MDIGNNGLERSLVKIYSTNILPNSFLFGLPSLGVASNFSNSNITSQGILLGSLIYVNTALSQAADNNNIVSANLATTLLGPFTTGIDGSTFPLNQASGTATPIVTGKVTIFTGPGPIAATVWTASTALLGTNSQSMFIFSGNDMVTTGTVTFTTITAQKLVASTFKSEIWVYNTNSGSFDLQTLTGGNNTLVMTPTTAGITINAGSFLTFIGTSPTAVTIKGFISTTNTIEGTPATLVFTTA